MKKISFWGIIMLLGIYWFTSCLDEGKDDSTGYVVGVLNYNETNDLYILGITDTTSAVYCPEFKDKVLQGEMEAGGCYYVVYSMNYTLPENAPHIVEANGYVTASLIDYDVAIKYNLSESFIDSSVVLKDEFPLLDAKPSDEVFGYSQGYLFMTHKISAQKGYEFDWSLSYDEETMMPTEVNKKNYYNLFLRATIAGNNNQTDTIEHLPFNAYYMGDYMMEAAIKEKESLTLDSTYNESSTFTVRLNYVSAIKGDTITWKYTEFSAIIDLFVPK